MMTILKCASRDNEKLWKNEEFEELERAGQIAQVKYRELEFGTDSTQNPYLKKKSMAWQCMLIILLLEAETCRSLGLSDKLSKFPAKERLGFKQRDNTQIWYLLFSSDT